MQTCNCCVHSCSPSRWRFPKSRQNSRSAQKMMLYSNLLQRIFSHKVFYLTVNRQYSGQDQMRALSLVWVHMASLRLCSDMLLTQGGRASPCPTWGWTWPLLPLLSAVLSNQGPQEKDCLSLRVCTAPIASAIIGIKVNKGRNGSNLSYRSQ